jgi:hypothetical protein
MSEEELIARYEMDFAWRAAWNKLANKKVARRLAADQEKIERKAELANKRIGRLIKKFDELKADKIQKKEELKPCPFCGGEAELNKSLGKNWIVICSENSCLVNPRVVGYQSSKPQYHVDVVAAWNTRAGEQHE